MHIYVLSFSIFHSIFLYYHETKANHRSASQRSPTASSCDDTYEARSTDRHTAYLRERQEGGRQGGGYAQQVVHDVLVSALLSHVYQHLVEVDRTHLSGDGTLPRLNSLTTTRTAATTTTIVHDATVAWYTFELHGMTAVAHPRRQPRRIANARSRAPFVRTDAPRRKLALLLGAALPAFPRLFHPRLLLLLLLLLLVLLFRLLVLLPLLCLPPTYPRRAESGCFENDGFSTFRMRVTTRASPGTRGPRSRTVPPRSRLSSTSRGRSGPRRSASGWDERSDRRPLYDRVASHVSYRTAARQVRSTNTPRGERERARPKAPSRSVRFPEPGHRVPIAGFRISREANSEKSGTRSSFKRRFSRGPTPDGLFPLARSHLLPPRLEKLLSVFAPHINPPRPFAAWITPCDHLEYSRASSRRTRAPLDGGLSFDRTRELPKIPICTRSRHSRSPTFTNPRSLDCLRK